MTAGDAHHATSDSTHCDPVGPVPGPLAPSCGSPPLEWTEAESSPWDQCCHEHHHAQQSVQIAGCDDRVGHLVLVNRLEFETHLQQGRHCEVSSVELHPYELEVLAGC